MPTTGASGTNLECVNLVVKNMEICDLQLKAENVCELLGQTGVDLNCINDVSVASAVNGDYLCYTGGQWINSDVPETLTSLTGTGTGLQYTDEDNNITVIDLCPIVKECETKLKSKKSKYAMVSPEPLKSNGLKSHLQSNLSIRS